MANWTVRPSTGVGETVVSAAPTTFNTATTYTPKVSMVTITDGNATKQVRLVQGCLPYCFDGDSDWPTPTISSGGGKTYFKINTDFDVFFSGSDETNFVIVNEATHKVVKYYDQAGTGGPYMDDDVTIKPSSGTWFSVSAAPNSTGVDKSSNIRMYHWVEGSEIGQIAIAQYSYPFVVSQTSQYVGWTLEWVNPNMVINSGAGSSYFSYTSEGLHSIWANTGDYNNPCDWATASADTSNSRVQITVQENPVGVTRSTTVNIYGLDAGGTTRTGQTGTLVQSAGVTSLIVAPTALTYDYLKSQYSYPLQLSVTANTNWQAYMDGNNDYSRYFIVSPSTGTGNGTISVTAKAQNTSGADKVNHLTISGGNASASVLLTQTPVPHMSPLQRTTIWSTAGERRYFQIVTYPNAYMVMFSGNTSNWDWIHVYYPNGNPVVPGTYFDADNYAGQNFYYDVDPIPSGYDYRDTVGQGIVMYHVLQDTSESYLQTGDGLQDYISGTQDA